MIHNTIPIVRLFWKIDEKRKQKIENLAFLSAFSWLLLPKNKVLPIAIINPQLESNIFHTILNVKYEENKIKKKKKYICVID